MTPEARLAARGQLNEYIKAAFAVAVERVRMLLKLQMH